MVHLPHSRRVLGHWLAVLLLARLGDALAQDALSEFQSLRTRFGTNQFLRFEEHATYSTSVSDHQCEWSRTTNGFRFQRRAASENSGGSFRATLHAPDHTDTLLKYQILRRAATNRYESPTAHYLPSVPITGCTQFATNIDGTSAVAFELTYLPPQLASPVPFSTREVIVFDGLGRLRSIQTIESTLTGAAAGMFPVHVSTTFGAYSTNADPKDAVSWDRYPIRQTANDAEWSKALREELLFSVRLRQLLELPWATKLLLLVLPVLILAGALIYLLFGRFRSGSN